MVEYFIVPGNEHKKNSATENNDVAKDRIKVADGYGHFAINFPHQGQVTVTRSLDYEKTQRYLVTIVASVSAIQFSTFLFLLHIDCARSLFAENVG